MVHLDAHIIDCEVCQSVASMVLAEIDRVCGKEIPFDLEALTPEIVEKMRIRAQCKQTMPGVVIPGRLYDHWHENDLEFAARTGQPVREMEFSGMRLIRAGEA